MLHLFASNVQCKHIFYACEPDALSLSTLDPYRNNFIVSSSITLIKSKAFKDPDIYLPFELMEIPSLFKVDIEEIQNIRVSERTRKSPERPRSSTTPNRQRQSFSSTVVGSTWGPETKSILLNIDNQRVDSQLDKLDPKAFDSFKNRIAKRKVCMWYHIDGRCANGSSCTYSHGPRLSAGETEVLRFKSRENPCENGSRCRNPNCHYGHMCPKVYCMKGSACRFRHVHGISRDAVKIYNGSNDCEVAESSPVAEIITDSSDEEISKRQGLGGEQAIADNALHFQVPLTILAPRNPNFPEEQEQRKIREAQEAAEEPYKRYFTGRKDV